ncbi:MAG: DUF4126 domain-containing protein [Longimicrobiales bacterium]|nr:DUF4126 domain-containing protein [Longimicrobiales bacterium]
MTAAIPVELLMLPPLAVAAGVDLYLTLLFIGAAPTMGLWTLPLPGALGDLDSPQVLIMVGTFYLAELAAERFAPAALVWNAFHAVIRPVSGALLALLLLDAQPLIVAVLGSLLGGGLASLAHGVRTGQWVLHGFGEREGPARALVSLAEDAAVLGLVSLSLDAPLWAFAVSVGAVAAASPLALSRVRAFAYAIRLGVDRVFRPLGLRKWRREDELPNWISQAQRDGGESPVWTETLRGCPAGGWRLKGAPHFVTGWIIVRGDAPHFVFKNRRGVVRIELGSGDRGVVRDGDLYRRIDLDPDGSGAVLLVGWSGPSTESLEAELSRALSGGDKKENL